MNYVNYIDSYHNIYSIIYILYTGIITYIVANIVLILRMYRHLHTSNIPYLADT